MYFIRHYSTFLKLSENDELKEMLKGKYNINCEVVLERDGFSDLHFDLSEADPNFNEIEKSIPELTPIPSVEETIARLKRKDFTPRKSVSILRYTPMYSDEEISNAHWFKIRNTFGRILHENGETYTKLECIYGKDKYGYDIGMHRHQVENIITKRDVKWNKNYFCTTGFYETDKIFCNNEARSFMETENVKGICYRHVIKKSTGLPFDNIYQIDSENIVPSEAVYPITGYKACPCKQCGMNMLFLTSSGRTAWGIKDGVLDSTLDVYKLPPMMGGFYEGPSGAADGEFVISKRLHDLLKEHKMDRNLVFEPIQLR